MNIIRYGFALVCVLLSLLASCNKDDFSKDSLYSPNTGSFSSVAIFNVIPNSSKVELVVQRGDLIKPMVAASDNLFFGKYLPYKNWYSGNFDLLVHSSTGSSNKVDVEKEVMNSKIYLDKGVFYSFFLYRNREVKNIQTVDDVILPGQGKAKVRIAHLCENLGNVRVSLKGVKDPLFKEESKYETISDFVLVDVNSVQGFIIQSSDGRMNIDLPLEKAKLKSKCIYTILLKGSFTQDGVEANEEFVSLVNQTE